AGVSFDIGDLRVHPLTPDHVKHATEDELDVLPLVIADRDGHGSFFTAVDVPDDEAMWRAVQACVPRPGVWSYTQNEASWAFQQSWAEVNPRATSLYARTV